MSLLSDFPVLFRPSQTLAGSFQIVIALAKFNQQFCQGNQVFHLETKRAASAAAHLLKLCPLFFGHSDVELAGFL
jgi:hypothetical protein